MATLNPGDEVIIPAPYWVSYADIVRLAEGTPIIIPTKIENGFKLQPEDLKPHITKKTKVFIFNSPSNPTGGIYSEKEVKELCQVLEPHDIIVLSDDIYEKILYDGAKFFNPAMISNSWKERTFVINGVSKAYSMTGWRIGYGAGNAEIIKNMDTIQGQSTSNASSISQAAAEEALRGDQSFIIDMNKKFDSRRQLIVKLLREIPGITCNMPGGAFYAFPFINGVYNLPKFQELFKASGQTSKSKFFSEYLLEKYLVAVVPGSAFGEDQAIRFSYALGEEDIKKGIQRLAECVRDFS